MSDQTTMPLTCEKPNKRPTVATPAMIMRAAVLVAIDLKRGGDFTEDPVEEIASDIVDAYQRAYSHDGYDLARELERSHGDTDQHRDQQGRPRHQNRKDPCRDRDHAMTGIGRTPCPRVPCQESRARADLKEPASRRLPGWLRIG